MQVKQIALKGMAGYLTTPIHKKGKKTPFKVFSFPCVKWSRLKKSFKMN